MDYTPQTEREIRDSMIMAPGEYDFEVVTAKDTVSKNSGNEMIAMSVRVFPTDGSSPRLINDYLVPGSKLGELKMNRFCHATGLQDIYFAGDLNGLACEGAAGKLRLTVSSSAQYGDSNSVKDYIVPNAGDEYSQAAPSTTKANKALNEFAEEQAALKDEDADCPF